MMWDVDVGLMELKGKSTTNTIGTPFLLRPSRFLAASSARRRSPVASLHHLALKLYLAGEDIKHQATSFLIHRTGEQK